VREHDVQRPPAERLPATNDDARRLLRAGVETELHVHPGAAHGYDSVTADAAFVARWTSDRVRVLTNV